MVTIEVDRFDVASGFAAVAAFLTVSIVVTVFVFGDPSGIGLVLVGLFVVVGVGGAVAVFRRHTTAAAVATVLLFLMTQGQAALWMFILLAALSLGVATLLVWSTTEPGPSVA